MANAWPQKGDNIKTDILFDVLSLSTKRILIFYYTLPSDVGFKKSIFRLESSFSSFCARFYRIQQMTDGVENFFVSIKFIIFCSACNKLKIKSSSRGRFISFLLFLLNLLFNFGFILGLVSIFREIYKIIYR